MNQGERLNLAHIVRRAAREDGSTSGSGAPGLLLLHGRGADEADLMPLEQALDPRLTIVSAHAPFRWGPGYAWYGMGEAGATEAETLQISAGELREFVEGVTPAYGIDAARLYLMGFSQGAVMSAALALTMPQAIRGVIMHSGYVPEGAGLDLRPDEIAGKPFFVAHGLYDDLIPVTHGRRAREYLSAAGADLTYREYPIGHSIGEESLYDLSEWLAQELDRTDPEKG